MDITSKDLGQILSTAKHQDVKNKNSETETHFW